MDPITGISLILTLIPFYQRERDKQDQLIERNKEDFFKWLVEHKFENIQECIYANSELCNQIEILLKLNHEQLKLRLNEIDKKLLSILIGIDEFKNIGKLLLTTSSFTGTVLSKQEESILRQFVDSGNWKLINTALSDKPISWHAGNIEIIVKDVRFFNSNLDRLAELGYLLKGNSAKGNTYYELTEQAVEYVKELKKEDLTEQAKFILSKIKESKDLSLGIILDCDGNPLLLINGTPIDLFEKSFIYDDLKQLESKGHIFLQIDNGTTKRYLLRRNTADN